MGLSNLFKASAIALTGALVLLCTIDPSPGARSAATIDDTGSIFDETPSGAPEAPSAPKETPPVRPATPTQTPAKPVKPEVKPSANPKVTPQKPKPVLVSPPKGSRQVKLPVPDGNARAASLKLVRELYSTDYSKTTPVEIRALAQRLLEQSLDTADDPTARYVLLSEASDRAAAGGDAALAMRAVRVLVRNYKIDGPAAALAALSAAVKVKTPSAETLSASARAALDFSREAAAANDFVTASAAADIALSAGQRGRDTKLTKVLKQNADRVAELRKGFEAVREPAMRLKVDLNLPEENLAVGKYRCFVRGDWIGGLRMLARGTDDGLKSLALKDIALREASAGSDTIISSEAGTAMADAWWTASLEATETELKTALQTRACQWYARAASEMTGLQRTKIENRLNDVRAARLKPGLVGHYYNSHRFTHQVIERIDPQINFAWNNGPPSPGINADGFAIWWSGYIKSPSLGRFKVIVGIDDACRIYLDGKMIVDQWHEGANSYTLDVDFTGRPQSILIEYGEVTGNAYCGLGWMPHGAKKVMPIPPTAFFHDPEGAQRIPMPRPKGTSMFAGHSYGTTPQVVNWYAARELCEQMGGHLAIIETAEEEQFMNDLLKGAECWIGMSDDEEEGIWRWINGRQVQYTSWYGTEPNGGDAENFGMTYHNGWADVGRQFQPAMCEWDD